MKNIQIEGEHVTQTADREHGLDKALTRAQVVMIGLGGAIGTGLFMGSGIAIGYAGPAVVVTYPIAGFVALVMVFSLSEMAVVHPTAGSFGGYTEVYLGPGRVSSSVIPIGSRKSSRSAAKPSPPELHDVLVSRHPGVGLVARFRVVLISVNSRSVSNFATFEYWSR